LQAMLDAGVDEDDEKRSAWRVRHERPFPVGYRTATYTEDTWRAVDADNKRASARAKPRPRGPKTMRDQAELRPVVLVEMREGQAC